MRRLIAASLLLVLAACGSEGSLVPPKGKRLPPAPYGATEPKDADELLQVRVQADPGRSVELRKRSEEREEDPFDLPPEG
ncbi:hypothetical protein NT2_01_04540 [Caenibius tardaugens NBRC 16725]|uniref:Argininosuccinate lyase n=1 Tax=Caenibius tardaugens NBRC 16725 TaxID=1219035 RepID=U2YI28_9SPHN|nr:hypothetical protein [Caenibius tardaugens]AZI37084.1 hypothetical protein EGO55_14865 [Caenibius tardaugens NBRC 16725]GAD47682.1 hypothetical protein NT2_01_04540 [Caenibius tardaugens NBRC 16725]